MKKCVSCSKKIDSQKNFCGYCGAAQPVAPEPTPVTIEVAKPIEKAPRQPRKIKINRKAALLALSALAVVGLTATALTFLLTLPNISAKDVVAKFDVNDSEELWVGDKTKATSSITLKSNYSGEYTVAVESFDEKSKSWNAIEETTGTGPKFSLSKQISLETGTNKYRLSVYRAGQEVPLYSSKVYKVKALEAFLPSKCPYKEFIALVGPDANMTMDPGQIEGDTIYCTMYPTLPGDYFLDLTYTKVSKEAWDLLKKERFGTDVSLGIGETYAYTYTYSDELSGSYDKTIVNFHGIMIDSDWGTDALKLAIEAIEVK